MNLKCEGIFKILVSYLVYNQIWLYLLVDDRKFGYITKLGEKKPPHYPYLPWGPIYSFGLDQGLNT
jgi:hypothetical protein